MKNGGEPQKRALPLDEVGRLVELLAESGVGEIRVRQGELEITIKAKAEAPAGAVSRPVAEAPRLSREPVAPEAPVREAQEEGERPGRDGLHAVRTPVVGTFYRAPAPGEDTFVEVGDRVKVGQTLCIVEAMKLMNEIPSDVSGEVVEILADNAEGVEYDQPLFHIQSKV